MNSYYDFLGRKRYNKVMAKRSKFIFMPHLEKRVHWGLLPPRKLMQQSNRDFLITVR